MCKFQIIRIYIPGGCVGRNGEVSHNMTVVFSLRQELIAPTEIMYVVSGSSICGPNSSTVVCGIVIILIGAKSPSLVTVMGYSTLILQLVPLTASQETLNPSVMFSHVRLVGGEGGSVQKKYIMELVDYTWGLGLSGHVHLVECKQKVTFPLHSINKEYIQCSALILYLQAIN